MAVLAADLQYLTQATLNVQQHAADALTAALLAYAPDVRKGSLTTWARTVTPDSLDATYIITPGQETQETIHLQINSPYTDRVGAHVQIKITGFLNDNSQLWIRGPNDPANTYPTILGLSNPSAILVWDGTTWIDVK
jgi:hypothetical protein